MSKHWLSTRGVRIADGEDYETGNAEGGIIASETVRSPYAPQPTGPAIESVLFTAFVVQ